MPKLSQDSNDAKTLKKTFLRPRESIPDSTHSFVNETQLALRSGDCSLHQDLAQIYQELAGNRAQIKRLSVAIELRELRHHKSSIALDSDIAVRGELLTPGPGSDTAHD